MAVVSTESINSKFLVQQGYTHLRVTMGSGDFETDTELFNFNSTVFGIAVAPTSDINIFKVTVPVVDSSGNVSEDYILVDHTHPWVSPAVLDTRADMSEIKVLSPVWATASDFSFTNNYTSATSVKAELIIYLTPNVNIQPSGRPPAKYVASRSVDTSEDLLLAAPAYGRAQQTIYVRNTHGSTTGTYRVTACTYDGSGVLRETQVANGTLAAATQVKISTTERCEIYKVYATSDSGSITVETRGFFADS